jgi:hypothetical protein
MLSGEEQAFHGVVKDFVDEQVRPVVRQSEHSDTYQEQLIETMKGLGIQCGYDAGDPAGGSRRAGGER